MGLSTSKSRVFSFSIQYPNERAVQPVTFTLPCRRPKSEHQRLTGEDGRASVNFCFEAFFREILQESRLSISMHSRRVRSTELQLSTFPRIFDARLPWCRMLQMNSHSSRNNSQENSQEFG
ncbi:Protein of unknown function [Pyronema omphalodes CBS 100304]|uniref:Uncharacterized protein n=1 Tax=Pyronema omphalodes (strain CBS 100304) TaxID=1076935 RepID=U4LM22_PYROM|nr:Protein of unknown function [Pyronema omphalodes CBS 100304]